jgi:SAM-dependent methyltransferase
MTGPGEKTRSEVVESHVTEAIDDSRLYANSPVLEYPDYLMRNRAAWERWAMRSPMEGRQEWEHKELRWGIWRIPESELHLVDGLAPGADVVELGCGTGSVSAGLARRGFRPVGVDIVRFQLETAARFEREFGLWFPLLRANAERLHYEAGSFDCVVSDYGASLWCDPRRWLPEAYRLLRPGGLLLFLTVSALLVTCTPEQGGRAGDRLERDYFSRYQLSFPGEDAAVEFHLTHGHWVSLLATTGFVLTDLIETRPPVNAQPHYAVASPQWAQRWPTEEIWAARKPVG